MMGPQDELKEAASPETSAERLQELALRKEENLRRSVARNPAISRSTALLLCEKFPEEFVENPSLPLWRMEDPYLFEKMPRAAGVALARCAGVTEEILWHLAHNPAFDVRCAIAESSQTTEEILELLTIPRPQPTSLDFLLFQALARHPRSPPRLLEKLARFPRAARNVSLHPRTPGYLRRVVCVEPEGVVPEVPRGNGLPGVLRWRLQRGSSYERRILADGDNPRSLLQRLANDPSEEVRETVAGNHNTPVSALLALYFDPNSRVRRSAFSHLTYQAHDTRRTEKLPLSNHREEPEAEPDDLGPPRHREVERGGAGRL